MAKEDKEEGKQGLQKTQPARTLNPFEEMDRFFESFFPRVWLQSRWPRPEWGELAEPFEGKMPRVDVVDRDNEILVKAELPGVDKKDLDVSVTENTVTIKGSTRHEETKEEEGEYTRRELSRGSFSRIVTLPSDVDGEKAKAEFKDGVLEMTLPKQKPSKRRRIRVH